MNAGNQASAHLTVEAEDFADCRVVAVHGRVDHTNSDRFLTELGGQAETVAPSGGMVVDLSGLEFITSAGLRALLLAQRSVTAADARLIITGVRGVVQEVFRISKFDALLGMAETTKEAVNQVSTAASQAYTG